MDSFLQALTAGEGGERGGGRVEGGVKGERVEGGVRGERERGGDRIK